jgi:hypothetical protein
MCREFIEFLNKYGIEYDEYYIWKYGDIPLPLCGLFFCIQNHGLHPTAVILMAFQA